MTPKPAAASPAQAVAAGTQRRAQRRDVALGIGERGRDRDLHRRAARERQELLRRAHAGDERGGPLHQPIFQPVNENDLPALEIVSVRSAIPGSVASGMCSPS